MSDRTRQSDGADMPPVDTVAGHVTHVHVLQYVAVAYLVDDIPFDDFGDERQVRYWTVVFHLAVVEMELPVTALMKVWLSRRCVT